MSRQSEKDEAATDEAIGYFNPQSAAIKRQPLGLTLMTDFNKITVWSFFCSGSPVKEVKCHFCSLVLTS